jgi:DNA polymerase-3 subunit alpha
MKEYVSLHNHTISSIGDSLITPKELISTTSDLNQKAVAITDHGSLAALFPAYNIAKKSNVKLIAGCECYFIDNKNETSLKHIILLAKNAIGYKNLLTINKQGYDNFKVMFKRAIPRIDWTLLEKYSEGLICTSACGNGLISQYIMNDQLSEAKDTAKRLQSIFNDNFALELQPHNLQIRASAFSGPVNQQKINIALKKIAEELNIRCVVTTDAHYVKQEHHRAHDVYLCNGSGQPIDSGARLHYDKHEFYIKNSDQIYAYFERHLQIWGEDFVNSLFDNTVYYANQCKEPSFIDPAVVTGARSQLPDFPCKDSNDYDKFTTWKIEQEQNPGPLWKSDISEDAQFYRYRSFVGLENKIAEGKIEEEDRQSCYEQMLEEFDVLEFRGFSSYMLITADFLEWCRNNDIVIGPGRGSVGGSLTAYLNNIHQANPKKYGLIFARFLNKFKEAFPDVDNDIAPSGREKLHNYLKEKYGHSNVAHVSNINTITPKVYARDISRVFNFGGEDRSKAAEIGNNIADSISDEIHSVKQALEEAPLFTEYAKQYPELAEFAELLHGKPRALSTHAGGIVISKFPLEGLVPLRRDVTGALVLEHDKVLCESSGLIKIDLLALETLSIIDQTYNLIKESGKEAPKNFDYESLDLETYKMISDGKTFGVFQLATTAVHVCKKIQPKNIDDIALVNALVRPAAKDIIPELVKVRNGEKEMQLLHPSLVRAFTTTYGFGLYEESLLYIALDVGKWNLNEADKLRKLTKEKGKNPEKVKQWRSEFIRDAIKNNIPEDIATKIWDETIELFNGYGFNHSHAILYSMLSYQTAFLKQHHFLEFSIANLMSEVSSNAKDAKDNICKIKSEIRSKGIKILQPDINTSETSWKIINDKTLRTGFDALKFMGKDAIPELLEKRPFTSFQDLIYRTTSTKVRSTSIQSLAAAGCLDSFGLNRKSMFYYASDYRAKLRSHMNKLYKAFEKQYIKDNKLVKKSISEFEEYYIDMQGNKITTLPQPSEQIIQTHLQTFNYPFPDEPEWTIQEKFALEEFYIGEGISGDIFDRYPNFFDKNQTLPFDALKQMFPWNHVNDDEKINRKANTHYLDNYKLRPLEGVITNLFVFTVKKEESPIFGQEMARIMITDPWGTDVSLLCFPEAWKSMKSRIKDELSGGKQNIETGLAIRFLALFQWENESSVSFILNEVLNYKTPPQVPEDRKSRSVKIPRTSKLNLNEIQKLSKEDLIDTLEEEMLDEGLETINSDELN